jgi:Txe/YoeB family toxin of Txe-Axe toxin-antitoxin module
MNTIEMIQNARPDAKYSTIKQYYALVNKLQKKYDTDAWKFLNDPEDVKKTLSDLHFTSRRNTYNAIVVLLMAMNFDNKFDDLIQTYTKMRNELNEQYVKEQESGIISEKQKDNFATIEEIQGMINDMEKEIKKRKLKTIGHENLTNADRELLTVYTLYQMLIRLPTRNDMAGMVLVNKTELKKIHSDIQEKTNYLLNSKDKMTIILNDYKTSKTYGQKEIEVPKDLQKIFKMFIRATGRKVGDILFRSSLDKPLSRNGISQLLLKTSKNYLGKAVSTTIMRKSVVSDKFSKKNDEQEKMADVMGHSVQVQNQTYVKKKS